LIDLLCVSARCFDTGSKAASALITSAFELFAIAQSFRDAHVAQPVGPCPVPISLLPVLIRLIGPIAALWAAALASSTWTAIKIASIGAPTSNIDLISSDMIIL
jgi:hypothetical protein